MKATLKAAQSGLMLPAGRRRQTHTGSISQTQRTVFHSAPFSAESFILKFFFGNKYVTRGADEVCMRHKQRESWRTRVEVQFWGTCTRLCHFIFELHDILEAPWKLNSPESFFFFHLVSHGKKFCKNCYCVFLIKSFWPGFTHEKKKSLFSCIHKIKTPAMFFQKINLINKFELNIPDSHMKKKLSRKTFIHYKYSNIPLKSFPRKKMWREIFFFLSEIFNFLSIFFKTSLI